MQRTFPIPEDEAFERFDCLSCGICPECGDGAEMVGRQGTQPFLDNTGIGVPLVGREVWETVPDGHNGLGEAGELHWGCPNGHSFIQYLDREWMQM